ncbi:MAG TPA: CopD family protein [Polyangiaceae bacterium]
MYALYTSSVIVHVVAACTWVGSLVFFAVVVVPTVRRDDYAAVRAPLVRMLGRRFRVLGWVSLGLLVVTGVSNLLLRGINLEALFSASLWDTSFGRTLARKLVFVALALLSTAAHDFLALRSRRASSWLGRATLFFSVCAVVWAVYLVRGMP